MEWISVKDRLPQYGHFVLFFTWRGAMIGSFWNDGWRERDGKHYYNSEVSHWMPLPEPPKP